MCANPKKDGAVKSASRCKTLAQWCAHQLIGWLIRNGMEALAEAMSGWI